MLLALASTVFLGSESVVSRYLILLSQFSDFPFRRLLRLAGPRWRYSIPPRSCSSLYSLGNDRIENTSPNSSTVASRSCRKDRVQNISSQLIYCCMLRICCLAKGVFAEPFPSKGCPCWLLSSCLEQICHNILSS
jgi:hypothetical protein